MNVDRLNKMVRRELSMDETIEYMQKLLNTGEVWWLAPELQAAAVLLLMQRKCKLANRSYVAIDGRTIPSQATFEKLVKEMEETFKKMGGDLQKIMRETFEKAGVFKAGQGATMGQQRPDPSMN